jgi:hypothetical protein
VSLSCPADLVERKAGSLPHAIRQFSPIASRYRGSASPLSYSSPKTGGSACPSVAPFATRDDLPVEAFQEDSHPCWVIALDARFGVKALGDHDAGYYALLHDESGGEMLRARAAVPAIGRARDTSTARCIQRTGRP